MNAALQLLESGGFSGCVERDDLAIQDQRQVGPPLCPSSAALRTISGNCPVFSLPRRDHSRTARGPSISTMARMPSYFGS